MYKWKTKIINNRLEYNHFFPFHTYLSLEIILFEVLLNIKLGYLF